MANKQEMSQSGNGELGTGVLECWDRVTPSTMFGEPMRWQSLALLLAILQEAIRNGVRHAKPAGVSVTLHWNSQIHCNNRWIQAASYARISSLANGRPIS
jgi:hypothetical protein